MSLNSWDEPEQLTNNESAPRFYSKQAIFGFSIFFSPIFGGFLLMQNLGQLGDRKGKMQILLFCLLYTAAVVFAVNLMARPNSNVTFLLNCLGAGWLLYFWWPKFISPEIQYRRKTIWKALVVSVLIMVPFVLAFLYEAGALKG
jgi:hypothetical protein